MNINGGSIPMDEFQALDRQSIALDLIQSGAGIVTPYGYFAVEMLDQPGQKYLVTISNLKKKINPSLKFTGILITMADMKTNYSREIVELFRGTYGSKLRIFDSIIPLSIRAAETSAEGKSIYLHDPAAKVAAAYVALTQEVMTS